MNNPHIAEAISWLEALRPGTVDYHIFLPHLREELEAGGLTPEDIGTTEEELEQLRIKGCKTSAISWLEALRPGTVDYHIFLPHLREELEAGGLTPEDIGTTEEELESFQKAA